MPTFKMGNHPLSKGVSERINALLQMGVVTRNLKQEVGQSRAARGILQQEVQSALESLDHPARSYVRLALDTDAIISMEDLLFDFNRNREAIREDLIQISKDVSAVADFVYQMRTFNDQLVKAKDLQIGALNEAFSRALPGKETQSITVEVPRHILEVKPGEVVSLSEALNAYLDTLTSLAQPDMHWNVLAFIGTLSYVSWSEAERFQTYDKSDFRMRDTIQNASKELNRFSRVVHEAHPGTVEVYSTESKLVSTQVRAPVSAKPLARSYVGFSIRTRESLPGTEVVLTGLGIAAKDGAEKLVSAEISLQEVKALAERASTHLSVVEERIAGRLKDPELQESLEYLTRNIVEDNDPYYATRKFTYDAATDTLVLLPYVVSTLLHGKDGNESLWTQALATDISGYSEEIQDSLLAQAWYGLYLIEEIQTYLRLVVGLKEMRLIHQLLTEAVNQCK